MITEDYVSFETAKLLKEKGFDERTEHELWYVVEQFSTGCHWNSCTYKIGDITREYDKKYCISMPTLQMAMKWLREVHGLFIRITEDITGNVFEWSVYQKKYGCRVSTCVEDSYEQAAEAAIRYCLENLI